MKYGFIFVPRENGKGLIERVEGYLDALVDRGVLSRGGRLVAFLDTSRSPDWLPQDVWERVVGNKHFRGMVVRVPLSDPDGFQKIGEKIEHRYRAACATYSVPEPREP